MNTAVEDVVGLLAARGQTVAVAESLTGGLLAAEFVTVPGVSAVFTGGVVAYDTRIKTSHVGVPAETIDRYGVVSEEVAGALAAGIRASMAADWGMGTTGVAGPEPGYGLPPGRFCVGVAGPNGAIRTETHDFTGSREQVRRHAVNAALRLLNDELSTAGEQGAC